MVNLANNNKIQLYEDFKRRKKKEDRKKARHWDQFEGNYYDSRVLIYVPFLIQRMKEFTNKMREKRRERGDFDHVEEAKKELLAIRHLDDVLFLQQAKKRSSVASDLAMRRASKIIPEYHSLVRDRGSMASGGEGSSDRRLRVKKVRSLLEEISVRSNESVENNQSDGVVLRPNTQFSNRNELVHEIKIEEEVFGYEEDSDSPRTDDIGDHGKS